MIVDIGAGFGRVGEMVAPLCKRWIGTDVSENMIEVIKRRLAGHKNVEAVATNGFDLSPIASASADMVYCTTVFMHLDEWERYNYIVEGFRILKPGGRMIVDNISLGSDQGWNIFHRAHQDPAGTASAKHQQDVDAARDRDLFLARRLQARQSGRAWADGHHLWCEALVVERLRYTGHCREANQAG